MANNNGVVDLSLFASVTPGVLASHVFPEMYSASGATTFNAKKEAVEKVIKSFKSMLDLNVQRAPKNWKTNRFFKVQGIEISRAKRNVVRCNLSCKKSCMLYCTDCQKFDNICTPIAKVIFLDGSYDDTEGEVKNYSCKVGWLYFHNHHEWRHKMDSLGVGGWCLVNCDSRAITGSAYDAALEAGRKLLHDEKGTRPKTRTKSTLGYKDCSKRKVKKIERAYDFIIDEEGNNRAQMKASNASVSEWTK